MREPSLKPTKKLLRQAAVHNKETLQSLKEYVEFIKPQFASWRRHVSPYIYRTTAYLFREAGYYEREWWVLAIGLSLTGQFFFASKDEATAFAVQLILMDLANAQIRYRRPR